MARRPSRQQCKKRLDGKCEICGEENYNLLDAHRIFPGEDGGTYHPRNVVTLCSNCHRREQAGEIRFDRKYPSTNGWTLHYFIGEAEFWKPVIS